MLDVYVALIVLFLFILADSHLLKKLEKRISKLERDR